MIAARIVADSINQHGDRLTTFELTMPKTLVAQFNTHRMIARNSASSRAIPTAKVIEQVKNDPYIPDVWRRNKKGMQPGAGLEDEQAALCDMDALVLRDYAVEIVEQMAAHGAAKEDINRYLEPWMWTTVVATATEWENYFKQRDHEDAQSAHATLARLMREAMEASRPVKRYGADAITERDLWHLPYVTDAERLALRLTVLPRLPAVRCARVSYGRQGEARDVVDELRRYEDFPRLGHWSPLEMPCRADNIGQSDHRGGRESRWFGPFKGWKPLRKFYAGESGTARHGTQHDDPTYAWRMGAVAEQDDK